MALKIGKREKLSAGIIIMILTIGAVHMLGFHSSQKNRSQRQKAYEEWFGKRGTTAPIDDNVFNRPRLDEYDAKTTEYLDEYDQIVTIYDLVQPEIYRLVNTETTTGTLKEEQHELLRRQIMYDHLRDLVEFRKDNDSTSFKLTFLGPQGWDLPEELAADLVRSQAAILRDRLGNINAKFNLLAAIDAERRPFLADQTRAEMYDLMRLIDIDVLSLQRIRNAQVIKEFKLDEVPENPQNIGFPNPLNTAGGIADPVQIMIDQAFNFVATLKLIAHLQLIQNPVLASNADFDFEKTLNDFIKHTSAVNLAMPLRLRMHALNEQMELLLQLLEEAQEKKISEVKEVYLYQTKRINFPDESYHRYNPIRMVVAGDHRRVWEFLWSITHSQRLLELDNMTITGDEEGNVTVDVLINLLTFSSPFSEPFLIAPPTTGTLLVPPGVPPGPGGGG